MYDQTIKDKFVELRADGKSFGKISEQLGVPKPTLHRWAEDHADDILRLRRTEWEDLEATGRWRVEDRLIEANDRIDQYEEHLRRFRTPFLNLRDTLALLRETRRERDRLRALLMGNGRPSRKSNKTERSHENGTTQHRATNDLQQSESEPFHFSDQPKIQSPDSKIENSASPR